ncbi:LOW QUALITY PROTEIN: NADP-dependent malic enzyme [Coregonus clupeaformis]|uniref:LOW QUALITY PROTEIN: NADP-dependent malic enzyme n=1 Tax=Coregonus clupeaformis TaxID=59861 RepID=UPI001E1C4907|nr:LOW QUALITY PROTEIN: NADP-dependent malic enzyme [Coregonus clupeaformis]
MAHGLVKRESVESEMHKSEDQSKTFVYTKKRGYDVTRNPYLNKGMAFSLETFLQLGIHGLLPPCFLSQDVQLLRVLKNYEMKRDDLDRYVFLMGLQDRNEKLFYRVLTSDTERFMPIVYTPTVGLACQMYGLAFRRPRGLFIPIHDLTHISTVLQSWPEKDIRAVCVTDGERILGLGDLGCYGMGIPVGKLALYTACGGMPPQQCLPVMLDVGTDNEELLKDPLYIGLRHKRIRGQAYDDLLEEFMKAVSDRYGMDCLIQFEDFANTNAFRLLSKYRNQYCTFNDDIQGTAAVAVAGLLAALRVTKSKMSDHTIVFQGAGEAAMGIADLITMAMEKEGLPKDEALRKIWMVDSKGLIVKGRDHLTHEKERFAHEHEQMRNLVDVVHELKPTAIIGVAAISGAFTEEIIRDMASFNERPIIFALSNPTSKAECTAEQCYTITEGRGIFASGSPFDPVTLPDGRTFFPGQGNNAYVFPGVGLGVTACAIRHVTDEIFLTTAETIADLVTEKDLSEGRLYPPLNTIRDVSLKLAVKIVEYAYEHKMATLCPEPEDKEAFVRSLIYSTDYDEFAVDSYRWPEDAMTMQSCKL